MRTRKESELTSGTHLLETGEGLVRTRKECDERGILTSWRRQRDWSGHGRKKPGEEHSRPGDGKGIICQDKERERPSEGYSLSGDGRWRSQGLSGHRKKATERGALTLWRWKTRGLIRTRKESDERGALTLWRW